MATATQPQRTMEPASFPFLDLPPELRLMVYERIPRTIKHIHVKVEYPPFPEAERSMTFVIRSLPMSILATCRLVNSEARDIVSRLATDFVLKATPKVLCATDPYCDLRFFLHDLFLIMSMESVSYLGAWLKDKCALPTLSLKLTDLVRAIPITTHVYFGPGPDYVRMHHHEFLLQDALEQKTLTESFTRWMKQTWMQHDHHHRAKTLCANQVIVKTPSVAVMESFEALGFSYEDNFPTFGRIILMNEGELAVAGF